MNGEVNTGAAQRVVHPESTNMVSDLSSEGQLFIKTACTPKTIATFGKRSNSIRRNHKAEVTKQGWLYKKASNGVKQWNKRWYVLSDRCLFYYKDEKEDTVLGSLPLLGLRIRGVEPSDNITRKFAFKVWLEEEVAGNHQMKGTFVSCIQAQHAGSRTCFFSTDGYEEQEGWIKAMNEAVKFNVPSPERTPSDGSSHPNHMMVTGAPDPQTKQDPHIQSSNETATDLPSLHYISGEDILKTSLPSTLISNKDRQKNNGKGEGEDHGNGSSSIYAAPPRDHLNGWGKNGPSNSAVQHCSGKPSSPMIHMSNYLETGSGLVHNPMEQQNNMTLGRGFAPQTTLQKMAQRKSSMAQLQKWVNQRRGMASQEDFNSTSHYFVNQTDYCDYPSGSHYGEENPLYPPGVRPNSICSLSTAGGYSRWTVEEKHRSLKDGPQHFYGPPFPRDSWGRYYCSELEASMRHLSVQPRSRSVPRSPSMSPKGLYAPVPCNFVSSAQLPSASFDQFSARIRDDTIYADPSIYGLRRSLSSPKYDYPGERRSLNQGFYDYKYPGSPSIYPKMVPTFPDVHSRELCRDLHPMLKVNEIETSKLLGRLCEQNQILKDHEAVVYRLRMDKDSLEEALVVTHQEMEQYPDQSLAMEKLQFKKETLQNQLIDIRGELSQASSALTTSQMEFEALEDEANAIHGDLWEQLNAGVQSESVRRHIQREFWRVQDVLEGLHKNNISRGTDTAKHRVSRGASGSFSTNSPASPLSSGLTSPLSPFSPVPGSYTSPAKQLGREESVPPRPPLPKSYYPLESYYSSPSSIPPLPFDSTTWQCSLGVDSYLDGEDSCIKKERPKSAVFPADGKSKMSIKEQNDRIRRNQNSLIREKRRSLNLSGGQSPASYRVVRRRVTAHEIDIKDLEAAVRGQGLESPREEIARLRRLQTETQPDDLDVNKEVLVPDCNLNMEGDTPLSAEEQREKQKKLERLKTLIAKSNLQNMVPQLDRGVEGRGPVSSQQQLQEQEKRIEISCALAAEASRRSRLLSDPK